MAEATLQVVLSVLDRSEASLSSFRARIKSLESDLRQTGITLAAIGGATTLAVSKFVGAAQEEERSIRSLDITLKNLGTSYAANEGQITATTAALMRQTAVADEAQRGALQRLITVTGSYAASLRALPVVLDVDRKSVV